MHALFTQSILIHYKSLHKYWHFIQYTCCPDSLQATWYYSLQPPFFQPFQDCLLFIIVLSTLSFHHPISCAYCIMSSSAVMKAWSIYRSSLHWVVSWKIPVVMYVVSLFPFYHKHHQILFRTNMRLRDLSFYSFCSSLPFVSLTTRHLSRCCKLLVYGNWFIFHQDLVFTSIYRSSSLTTYRFYINWCASSWQQ